MHFTFKTALKSRSFHMLLALIALNLGIPLVESLVFARPAIAVFFVLVVVASVSWAHVEKRQFWVALSLGALTIGFELAFLLTAFETTLFLVARNSFALVLLAMCVFWVLLRLLRAKWLDFDLLCAAIGGYLLLATSWAFSYQLIEVAVPGAFSMPSMPETHELTDFLYFSLVTITTLGFGDISPTTPFARIWAAFEAFVGAMYLAILIAQLVKLVPRWRE